MSSIDGKISDSKLDNFYTLYDQIHNNLKPDAWMCGRVTMEMFAAGVNTPLNPTSETNFPATYIAPQQEKHFAIAVDTKGLLRWKSNIVKVGSGQDTNCQLIVIITKQTPTEYLAYLQEKQISYISAGENELDLTTALQALKEEFKIETLLLEGGGLINGSMLQAYLIDEISLLVCPFAVNNSSVPSLFEHKPQNSTGTNNFDFQLIETKQFPDHAILLRYKTK